jgi:hypothetical protein
MVMEHAISSWYGFGILVYLGDTTSYSWMMLLAVLLEPVELADLTSFGPKPVQIADSDRFRPVLYRNRPVPYKNWSIQYRTVRFHTGLYSTTRDPWISIFVFKTLK